MSSVDRFAVYVQGLTSQPFRCISRSLYIHLYACSDWLRGVFALESVAGLRHPFGVYIRLCDHA